MGMGNQSVLFFAVLCILSLLIIIGFAHTDSHFEGFEAEYDDDLEDSSIDPASLRSPPLSYATPTPPSDPSDPSDLPKPPPSTTTTTSFDFWDDDEFEGVPVQHIDTDPKSSDSYSQNENENETISTSKTEIPPPNPIPEKQSFTVEILCVSFLIMFAINYFTGKRENENIALSWAAQFASKDSIFEKNFSLVGIGEGGEDSPLLLKEGQTCFKFYASGRRYCQGLLATLDLKSRHDLIARLYNFIVPSRDEISFEVYMNDDSMDHVIFALAKKKLAKSMLKDLIDLHRFATLLSPHSSTSTSRKLLSDDLSLISESKEVANDLITDAVIDQVLPSTTLSS